MSERSSACSDVAPDDARADERVRIHVRMAQELVAIGMDAHGGARRQAASSGVAALSISLLKTQGWPARMRRSSPRLSFRTGAWFDIGSQLQTGHRADRRTGYSGAHSTRKPPFAIDDTP